jgi:hypothetical protein
MTLHDLKSVLDNALKAAYERREKIPKGVAYGDCWAANEQNIQLLQDLHLGVIRTMDESFEEGHFGYCSCGKPLNPGMCSGHCDNDE